MALSKSSLNLIEMLWHDLNRAVCKWKNLNKLKQRYLLSEPKFLQNDVIDEQRQEINTYSYCKLLHNFKSTS